ncbi:MAG: hypothetical protein WA510_08280 [Acidobacteriaceae bacterium]
MKAAVYFLMTLTSSLPLAAQANSAPQWHIENSVVKAQLYLPDAAKGFYRGTRFDWSGVVGDLEYAGHSYYGPWFTQTDPTIPDFVYRGPDIVAGPCSAITGPVEEFVAVGYEEAKPGGTFLKIGVGILRKPDDAAYSAYRLYDIVNGGKWSVKKSKDAVEFTQELEDAPSGYGYVYQKTIRLIAGKPEMEMVHAFRNTGKRAIRTSVYDHNFLVLDKRTTGAGYTITLPFQISSSHPPERDLAEIRKNQIVFLRTFSGEDRVYTTIDGFSNNPDDYKIRIENTDAKAGMTITGDRPLAKMALWSIRSVVSLEPFVDISVEPQSHTSWRYVYQYDTLAR